MIILLKTFRDSSIGLRLRRPHIVHGHVKCAKLSKLGTQMQRTMSGVCLTSEDTVALSTAAVNHSLLKAIWSII